MNGQAALRVRIEGMVTSFRYPHFIHGVQPTFDFPPPATLYGHVCSTLGELVPPESFRLALHFTYASRFRDYEHTHLVSSKEVKLSPFKRELLFKPQVTLYLDRPEWAEAFRRPRYVVTLGRSQDLMTYREVSVVQLERARSSYIEHTLMPLNLARELGSYSALRLPVWISPERYTRWGDYAAVRVPQTWDAEAWVDPTAPQWRGLPRAVIWLELNA